MYFEIKFKISHKYTTHFSLNFLYIGKGGILMKKFIFMKKYSHKQKNRKKEMQQTKGCFSTDKFLFCFSFFFFYYFVVVIENKVMSIVYVKKKNTNV